MESEKSVSVDCLILHIDEESTEETQLDSVTSSGQFTAFMDWFTITKPFGMNIHALLFYNIVFKFLLSNLIF